MNLQQELAEAPAADLPTWENGDDPLVGGGLISRGVVDFATAGIWPTNTTPAEAPVDVARDAERWAPIADFNVHPTEGALKS